MAETKATRKELFARIAETMANDPEVVKMCEKYIAQLSKPRKRKVNEAMIELANEVAAYMREDGQDYYTNKMLVEWYNGEAADDTDRISYQKMAAVLRYLVGTGVVEKNPGEKASDAARFSLTN